MMKIQLNNREELFEEEKLTVSEILALKNFSFKMLVIKLNGKLIKKTDYDTTMVSGGDEMMVLHLISGG